MTATAGQRQRPARSGELTVDVVVEVGGWEHGCCGRPIERGQLVDFHCRRYTGEDGVAHFAETHHDLGGDVDVRGRVIEIRLVQHDRTIRILRVPGGRALCGLDDADDGHLEDLRTGARVTSGTHDFLITVST